MAPFELTWTLKFVLTLCAKNWVRPKRDDNLQCGADFTQNLLSSNPNYLLITSHVYIESSSSPSSPHSSLDFYEVFFEN